MIKTCAICDLDLDGRKIKYCSAGCRKTAERAAWLRKIYDISLEEYDAILAYQDGRCGVCTRLPRGNETFHVDHEHGGHVRGLLCAYCNTRLVGRLKSSVRAQQLADYLRCPPAVAALGEPRIAPGRPRKPRQPRKRKR